MSAIVKNFTINARYDLQSPSVQIFYETASNVDGSESLSLATDFYPNPLPTAPLEQYSALQFTVDLQGLQATSTTAAITVEPITPTDPNWWLGKHPQYKPFDPSNPADTANEVASFTIDAATLQRSANPAYDAGGRPVKDSAYIKELTTGQLTDWMTSKAQRITLAVKATIVMRTGDVKTNVPLTYQCLSTNAASGTFTNQQITALAEPVPFGLAQAIYEAISVLQFEGEIVLQEEDVSASLNIGNVFNLSGGALAEWSTMVAMIQGITEDIDSGQTTVNFGPPRNLSAGELVDLLRVNRSRLIRSAFSMRPSGTGSDSSASVDLGQNTPEKNSASGTVPSNPSVTSGTPDGDGGQIKHDADEVGNATSSWTGKNVAGSIVIDLGAAGGSDISIQEISICLNGVPGKMKFLCSGFTPDP